MAKTAPRFMIAIAVVVGALSIGGCPCEWPPAEPQLQGTWEYTFGEGVEDIGALYITFDSLGNMRWIALIQDEDLIAYDSFPSYVRLCNGELTYNATFSDNTLEFTGTLSEDKNTASGTMSLSITYGDLVIDLTDAPVTMRRLVSFGT